MKAAVISDIHANAPALFAVLTTIRDDDVEAILCLGDMVGVHTYPAECLDLLRAEKVICVAGNHDEGVRGTLDANRFLPVYWRRILWTRAQLRPRHIEFLRRLPTHRRIDGRIWMMHGMAGRSYRYLDSPGKIRFLGVRMIVEGFTDVLFGHTHRESWYRLRRKRLALEVGSVPCDGPVGLEPPGLYLLNPGTVGDPRGEDRRARYAIVDFTRRTVCWKSVEYDSDSVFDRTTSTFPETTTGKTRVFPVASDGLPPPTSAA